MTELKELDWFDVIMQWADEYGIEELDINNEGIPNDKDTLCNLTELDLMGYDIKYIPKEIKYLQKLKSLDLTCASLESIPNEIGNLSELEYLCLGASAQTKDNLDLPESIKNLKNLEYVSLCGTFSKKSIELLLDLPLDFLEITHNHTLTSLPEDFFID